MSVDVAATMALRVSDLRVELAGAGVPIVEDVTLDLAAGRVLGLVGESGSGKTTLAHALLGFARPGLRIAAGQIVVGGQALVGSDERSLRRLRGDLVSYVPQDPSVALNPSMRVGAQVAQIVRRHRPGRDDDEAVASVLERCGLPSGREFVRRYPHQLSGGQQQRVAIAMAIVCEPALVVLDEPTTGLDVVTQARILEEVGGLVAGRGTAVVYVSHDLAVVAQVADEVAVMYGGTLVEHGPVGDLLASPRHPYTRGLLGSVPDHVAPRRLRGIPGGAVGPGERPDGCLFAPRCELHAPACDAGRPPLIPVGAQQVRCIRHALTPPMTSEPPDTRRVDAAATPLLVVERLRAVHATRDGEVIAADDVSFTLTAGETLALVGESGSGKTTIARCVAGLHRPEAGRVVVRGEELRGHATERTRAQRRQVQIVFQNPYESLNPRHRAVDAVARAAQVLRGLPRAAATTEAQRILDVVRLPSRLHHRFPHELSGGERQRVAIARALAAEPELLVCDEVTSALDASVQAAVLSLLADLRSELDLAVLFITHDLGVVAAVADRVVVLQHGRIVDAGPTAPLLAAPTAAYTRTLVEAAPRLPRPPAEPVPAVTG